ncbi:MAG: TolC family protein [Ignavibacteria bacterium]|nr:TolC family protein [Ignavibacteria bacterium]
MRSIFSARSRLLSGKVFILLLITSAAYPQKVLTLDEAINIALQRNSLLQIGSNNLKTFESGLMASYGNLLPTISANGNWEWRRNDDAGTSYNIGGFVLDVPPSITENRSYSVGANANWTLFDGLSNIAYVSQSENDLDAARLSLDRLKQDVMFQTISFYYEVINIQQLLKVAQDDVLREQKNFETITERNKLGAVTLADFYAQQVNLGNAELAEIRAKNNLETTKADLLYYLGLDVLEDYSFPDDFTMEELDMLKNRLAQDYKDVPGLVSDAMNNRFDYKSALLQLESANDGVTIARSGHFPRLTNSIGFSSFANKPGNLFDSKSYSVGLTLSVPIFSGFSVSNQVEFATVNAMNQEVELTDLERDIKRNIQKTYLDLQAAEKSLNVSEKNVEAAEENLRIEEEKYNLGSSRLLDVLVARTNFTNARVNYINAQFAYIVLSKQLKYYLGILEYKN